MGERFTAAELLAEARVAGVECSPRQLKELVRRGVLDRADERGKGRGRGIERTWPAAQRDLLVSVCATGYRQWRITIPLEQWLQDDPAGIPVRQVRRALATWVMPSGVPSHTGSRWVTNGLLERLASLYNPWDRQGQQLFRTVAQAIHQTTSQAFGGNRASVLLDKQLVEQLLEHCLRKYNTHTSLPSAFSTAPEHLTEVLARQIDALGAIVYARALDRRGQPRHEFLDHLDGCLHRSRLVLALTRPGDFPHDGFHLLPVLAQELHVH